MLQVETYLNISEIHGVGLFAAEKIPEGTKIWEYTPEIDIILTREQIEFLCDSAKKQLYNFTYINFAGKHVLCADNARFMNHSDSPNTKNIGFTLENEGITIALKDILKGQEITTNYHEFDPTENLDEWFKNHPS